MGAASAFSAAAVLVACAFAGATFERWLARRRRHDLAWASSMALFAAGALAYFLGVALGWRPWIFKAFYLLGGVLTVPVLALGTIYLLIGRRWGDRVALATALVGAFASGIIVAAPLRRPLSPDRLDAGREVLGLGPRLLAAVGSGLGATVVIGGALWSAWRLWRRRPRLAAATPGPENPAQPPIGRAAPAPGPGGSAATLTAVGRRPGPSRLALANLLIAAGTLLISLKRPFEALAGSEETGFAMALAIGLAVVFVGFLVAAGPRPALPALPAPTSTTAPNSTTSPVPTPAGGAARTPDRPQVRPAEAAQPLTSPTPRS